MGASPNPILGTVAGANARSSSQEVLLAAASNEFFFAVVGHAGSGTSEIAGALADLLKQTTLHGEAVQVQVIKARAGIEAWARQTGRQLPSGSAKTLSAVTLLQDYGDEMRKGEGKADHAAVARRVLNGIREARAIQIGTISELGKPVVPDGKPRAFVVDALRHPAEVEFLRRLYGNAFVLIGVVCEEQKRSVRLREKYAETEEKVRKFMLRDADAKEKHGQHVAGAFQLSDFFVDNTTDRTDKGGNPNKNWDVIERLSRLVKILTHEGLVRPEIGETAMYHANSVKMRSACLSRQVGAALADSKGNIIATGTNEVPRAGGGVYGETFGKEEQEGRCGLFSDPAHRYCRNTQQQNTIIRELLEQVPELRDVNSDRKKELEIELRNTRIGQLVEFSRAVHAEMDALLSAARTGASVVGTRLFVTTFPCHYCARHIVAAGVDEVQYIEPYPKSQALNLHSDAIAVEYSPEWVAPSESSSGKVLFRPFSGIAPRLYRRAFLKERALKNDKTGMMEVQRPAWGTPWDQSRVSYPDLEVKLDEEGLHA